MNKGSCVCLDQLFTAGKKYIPMLFNSCIRVLPISNSVALPHVISQNYS